MNDEPQLAVAEAARVLGLRESTIRRWILQRRITYTKLGRSVRIPHAEVLRLVREGRREAISR